MEIAATGFDWDRGNRSKCLEHGVSSADIEGLFRRPLSLIPDQKHSLAEERLKAIGTSPAGRYMLVVFTLRKRGNETLIRPISARYMRRKEIRHYEEQKTKAEKASSSQDR